MGPCNLQGDSLNEKLSNLSIGHISVKDRRMISTLARKYNKDVERQQLADAYHTVLEKNGSRIFKGTYDEASTSGSVDEPKSEPTNAESNPVTKILQKMNKRRLQLDNLLSSRQARQENLKKTHRDKLERIQYNRRVYETDIENWKADFNHYSKLIENKCELKCKQFYLHRSNLVSSRRQSKERKLTATLDKLRQEEKLAKETVLESVLSKQKRADDMKKDMQKRVARGRINSEISRRLRENIREIHDANNFSDMDKRARIESRVIFGDYVKHQ